MARKKPAKSNGNFGDAFHLFAAKASFVVGTKWAFLGAVVIILAWAVLGPYYHFSNTWQLVVNTGTTIVTFLIVFLIQNTQNRDARAIHLKLDEIIRSLDQARNDMIDVEDLSDEELAVLSKKFENIRKEYQSRQKTRVGGNGS